MRGGGGGGSRESNAGRKIREEVYIVRSRWLVVVNACRVVDEDSRGLGSTTGSRGEGNLEETNGAGKGKGRSSAYFYLAASVASAKIHFPTKCRHGRASSCWS